MSVCRFLAHLKRRRGPDPIEEEEGGEMGTPRKKARFTVETVKGEEQPEGREEENEATLEGHENESGCDDFEWKKDVKGMLGVKEWESLEGGLYTRGKMEELEGIGKWEEEGKLEHREGIHSERKRKRR